MIECTSYVIVFRVKGITNLRVADSSVLWNVPSGNTNAPTIMIGGKTADMIKIEYI